MSEHICPSCHGLNISCPDGCGRDPKTGELNGTRLTDPYQIAMGSEREQIVEARIYDQEGNLQPFNMEDTPDNRHFAEFLRIHDRYTPRGDHRQQNWNYATGARLVATAIRVALNGGQHE